MRIKHRNFPNTCSIQCSWSSFTATQTHSLNEVTCNIQPLPEDIHWNEKQMSACNMPSHHTVLYLFRTQTSTHCQSHTWHYTNTRKSGLICCSYLTFLCSEFCITSRVSSDRQNEITAQRSMSCERVSTPEWVDKNTRSFQDLLTEGVWAWPPSNGEFQSYQVLHPNRPCPSGLSAWEPWVPLQP